MQVGDPQEVNAITDVFCKDRNTPLLVGSVKSNMGHSEPASGLCSVAKVLIAMESGVIPPNLHYQEPNADIPALSDGRLQVNYVKHNKVEILRVSSNVSVWLFYVLISLAAKTVKIQYWQYQNKPLETPETVQFSSCSCIIP